MAKRICVIGLEKALSDRIREAHFGPFLYHITPPKMVVKNGKLFIERSNGVGMLQVDKVIFHGIYENDLDFITGLALWGGDCFPNAFAMMNCRLKLPCLARALKVSKFNHRRGFVSADTLVSAKELTVAKWGNWHCGENKEKFDSNWKGEEASVLEPFFEGEAVRVVIVGEKAMQIKLEGKDWLKSIHDEAAHFMDIDDELLEDTKNIKEAFGMDIIANDYIVSDSNKYLLEVNHIPNVMRFQELQNVYLETVIDWIKD